MRSCYTITDCVTLCAINDYCRPYHLTKYTEYEKKKFDNANKYYSVSKDKANLQNSVTKNGKKPIKTQMKRMGAGYFRRRQNVCQARRNIVLCIFCILYVCLCINGFPGGLALCILNLTHSLYT